ncbi:MAG: transcriptional regulator, partial [Spirulinaceae cyanobacterium]
PPCKLSQLGKSLRNLELATPKLKQAIVAACAHTVLEDQQVTLREAELLRAVVIALDCPIPPFLDAATVGRSG